MLTESLLMKLLEVERSLGSSNALDSLFVRRLVMEAEAEVLRLEKEQIALMLEMATLREQCELGPRSAVCRICPVCNAFAAPNAVTAQA